MFFTIKNRMGGVSNMDCTLILTAVYAAAAVVSMTVTACSAIETKKILSQIKTELLKNKDNEKGSGME